MTKARKLKPHPKYVQTNLPWLDQVPSSWKIVRLDSVFELVRNTIRQEDMCGKTVFHYSIPSIQEYGDGQVESGDEINSDKLLLSGGELIVSKLNPRKATVLLSKPHKLPLVASTEFVALKPKTIHPQYALYLYLSHWVRERISSVVQSATKSHQRANPSEIYKLWVPLPCFEEQIQIASFLDRETAKLDQLVEKKQRLIELLQEYRQALITQAVTKGLDPNVPMKDSGIPWLGEVPAQWKVTKLKYCVEPLDHKRIPLNSEERANLDRIYPYYGASGIIDYVDRFIFDEDLILIGEDGANLFNRSSRLVFIARGKYWVNNHAHILRPKGNIIFWADRLESIRFDPYITGSAQPKLTLENLLNVDVSYPPDPVEQDCIAEFIESTNNKYDKLIEKLSTQIEIIKEYRQALISAAVTGQIDVRESLADEVEVSTS